MTRSKFIIKPDIIYAVPFDSRFVASWKGLYVNIDTPQEQSKGRMGIAGSNYSDFPDVIIGESDEINLTKGKRLILFSGGSRVRTEIDRYWVLLLSSIEIKVISGKQLYEQDVSKDSGGVSVIEFKYPYRSFPSTLATLPHKMSKSVPVNMGLVL